MPILTPESANAALKRLLLSSITPAIAAETEAITRTSDRIKACIERVMVAQAQKALADLEALAVMEELVGEMYGAD